MLKSLFGHFVYLSYLYYMKFTITETEKSEIRGLYNLNEQIIKIVKTGYDVGFQKGMDVIFPGRMELENIVGNGDLITADLVTGDGTKYSINYRCSSKKLQRNDGYKVERASQIGENELQTLKDDLNKFCDV